MRRRRLRCEARAGRGGGRLGGKQDAARIKLPSALADAPPLSYHFLDDGRLQPQKIEYVVAWIRKLHAKLLQMSFSAKI